MTDPDTTGVTDAPSTPTDERPDRGDAGDQRGPGFVLAVSAAVLFAVLAVVLAVLLAAGDDGDGREEELRRAAGRFAEALVTYDYRNPDEHRDTVLQFATGSFREEYEEAFDEGLARVITEVEAVSDGVVNDVFTSAIDEERASAVVSVDIDHDGTGGRRTLRDIYFRLGFVYAGGEWKVDQVTDLSFAATPAAPPGLGEDGAEAPGDTTTSTSASTTTSVP